MELGRQPATRRVLVAGRAIGAGADVIDPLACGLGTIVTTCADGCRGKTRVVHLGRRQPRAGLMAGIA